MSHDDAFLQAIVEQPDDDTPRLIYADWLDEHGNSARAEFIRLQCHIAKASEEDPNWIDLVWRERSLVQEHGIEWVGDLWPSLVNWTFQRGFLDEIVYSLSAYLKQPRPLPPPTVRCITVSLADAVIEQSITDEIPESVARENLLFPVQVRNRTLTLAMPDPYPFSPDILATLASVLNRDIEIVVADQAQIIAAINRYYGGPEVTYA